MELIQTIILNIMEKKDLINLLNSKKIIQSFIWNAHIAENNH
jgi:hypothetical protein